MISNWVRWLWNLIMDAQLKKSNVDFMTAKEMITDILRTIFHLGVYYLSIFHTRE